MSDLHTARQLAHIRECLAECDRPKTQHEIEAAIARAAEDARRDQGRREPVQAGLDLKAA